MSLNKEIIASLMAAAPKEVPVWFRPDFPVQECSDVKWVNSDEADQFLDAHSTFFKNEVGARPDNLFEALEMVKSYFEADTQQKAINSLGDMEKMMELKSSMDQVNTILGMLKTILDKEKEMPENQPFIHTKAKREIAEKAQWSAVWAIEAYAHLDHVFPKMLEKGISAFTHKGSDIY